MRALIVFVALQPACIDCWEAPERDAGVAIRLEGGDTTTGTADYRIRVGEASGCDDAFAQHDDSSGYTFTPLRRGDVRMGPPDALVQLAEKPEDPGSYAGSGATVFAPSYRFAVGDAEQFELESPTFFTASFEGVPPVFTIVNGPATRSWGQSITVWITRPDGSRHYDLLEDTGALSYGVAFTLRGEYVIELSRNSMSSHPDHALVGGSVTLTRVLRLWIE